MAFQQLMPLSTPSLGITDPALLSDLVNKQKLTFNSLSRDHTLKALEFGSAEPVQNFQLPLSGSRDHKFLICDVVKRWIHAFNSLSRDHLHVEGIPEASMH